jgi:hypothetical protein
MPRWKKTLLGLGVLSGLGLCLLFGAMMALFGLADSLCGNQVIEEVYSPNLKHRAVAFERDCGATTGFSTHIAILPGSAPLADGSSLFVADTDHGAAPAGPSGGPAVQMQWLGEGILEIGHHHAARVLHAERQGLGVALQYRQF